MFIFLIIVLCLIIWTCGAFLSGFLDYKRFGYAESGYGNIVYWLVWPMSLCVELIELCVKYFSGSNIILKIIDLPLMIWKNFKDENEDQDDQFETELEDQ